MSELWKLWHKLTLERPDKPILHMPEEGWQNVRQINGVAERLWSEWQTILNPGCIVLLSAPNGPEWLAAFLALQKMQVIVASADPSTPEHLLETLATDIGAARICNGNSLLSTPVPNPVVHRGLCLAKLTSGSTGKPKAILFRDSEMIADGLAVTRDMGITAEDINYAMIPFGHSYGLGNILMPLLLQGSACACSRGPLPRLAVQDMKEAGATVCPSVPAFFRALTETDLDFWPQSLRRFISAGSALPMHVATQFEKHFNLRIHNFLGSSETGGIAYDADGSAALSGTSVGKPMTGVNLSTGKDGRLVVSGPAVARFGNRLKHGGMPAFRLGDKGRLDEAGNLVLLGRATPLAKIGGRRVDPTEVERTIRSIEGIADAYVLVTQIAGNDRLFALVESQQDEHTLREKLRDRLPDWKIPRKLVLKSNLKRDERGKVKRSYVSQMLGISQS